jgi:hypothetical protein
MELVINEPSEPTATVSLVFHGHNLENNISNKNIHDIKHVS